MMNLKEYYNKINLFKRTVYMELPVIGISIFLFLTLWLFFGKYNIILPPFLTLFFKIKSQQDFRIKELIKNYLMIIGIALMSFLAGETLLLCVVLNLTVPFFIVYFLTNKFTPKSYFVYGMAFVFMQLIPIPFTQLIIRFGALLYSFGVITLALFLYSKYLKKDKKYENLKGKILVLSNELRKLVFGEDISVEKDEILVTISTMNQLIYSTRSSRYLTTEYGKVMYLFMLIFQKFDYYIEYCLGRREKLNKEFLLELANLFEKIGKEMKAEENRELIVEIENFQKNKDYYLDIEGERVDIILNLLKIVLREMSSKNYAKYEKKWKVPKEENKLKNLDKIFQIEVFQIRFALRLSLVLCISFTFVFTSKFDHSYWVPMSSFLMLMPYAEESKAKIVQRILGTIFGIAICWILISVYHGMAYRIFIIILMTVLMYTAPVTSWTMTLYTTCYGMTLATMTLGLGDAIILRLYYVAIAVVITWLANSYILPNTAYREFRNSIRELFQIDKKMLVELKNNYTNTGDINKFRHFLMEANMLTNEIKSYISKEVNENKKSFYIQMLKINQTLIIEMEELNSYLYFGKKKIEVRENLEINEILRNLEDTLERVCRRYSQIDMINFLSIEDKNRVFKNLKEEIYFNELILKCINSTKELEKLCENFQ